MNVLCLGSEIVGAVGGARARRHLPRCRVRRRRALRRPAREGCGDGEGDEAWLSRGLHQLAARGQSVWIDLLSRELVHGGELAADDRRGRRHRPHVEPDDLPEGDRRRQRLRRADRRAARDRARRPGRDLLRARDRRRPGRLRRAAAGLGRDRRAGRLRLARGRPGTRGRHRRDARAGDRAARARSSGRTSTSRSRPPSRGCRRSRTRSPAASRSTSR